MEAKTLRRRDILMGAGTLGAAAVLARPVTALADDGAEGLLGAWVATINSAGNGPSNSTFAFASGGAFSNIDDNGGVGVGQWQGGGHSVTVSFIEYATQPGPNGPVPVGTVRIDARASRDGNQLSGKFRVRFTPVGGVTTEVDHGTFVAHRLKVEPPPV